MKSSCEKILLDLKEGKKNQWNYWSAHLVKCLMNPQCLREVSLSFSSALMEVTLPACCGHASSLWTKNKTQRFFYDSCLLWKYFFLNQLEI